MNTGANPIIFLKPQKEHEGEIFWLGGISLSLAKFLAERGGCNSTIWVQSHYPAVSIGPEFREMAKRLDQPTPPPDLTHILRPKESWIWQTTTLLRFYAKTMASVYSAHDLPWEVIGKIPTALWMRLDYEVWSRNLSCRVASVLHFSQFQTGSTKATLVLRAQFRQSRRTQFHLPTPAAIEIELACKSVPALWALLRPVYGWQRAFDETWDLHLAQARLQLLPPCSSVRKRELIPARTSSKRESNQSRSERRFK